MTGNYIENFGGLILFGAMGEWNNHPSVPCNRLQTEKKKTLLTTHSRHHHPFRIFLPVEIGIISFRADI